MFECVYDIQYDNQYEQYNLATIKQPKLLVCLTIHLFTFVFLTISNFKVVKVNPSAKGVKGFMKMFNQLYVINKKLTTFQWCQKWDRCQII